MIPKWFRRISLGLLLMNAGCAPALPPAPPPSGDAFVTLLSDPPGAQVRINGALLAGTTPLLHQALAPGFVQVEMTLAGYRPSRTQQTLEPGDAMRIDIGLEPLPQPTASATPTPTETVAPTATRPTAPATLTPRLPEPISSPTPSVVIDTPPQPRPAVITFATEPSGATVTLNDRELGTTPITALEVEAGAARIIFALPGFETVDIERDWAPGAIDRVEAVLFPLQGTVRFDSATAWATLEVDGDAVEVRPGEPHSLIEGKHSVRAMRGNEVAHTEFKVIAGSEVRVALEWRRWRPDTNQFAHVAATTAALGDAKYGEDNPVREVKLGAFWLGRTEVTVAQYGECVAAGKCAAAGTEPGCNAGVEGRGTHPINCVSTTDAVTYADWLSERTGMPHELPHCDQWERAARQGGRYPWGDAAPEGRCNTCDASCPFVNFRHDATDDGWRETAPVGALGECRGAAGIFDLIGNVAEWCVTGGGHHVRGGSWGQVGVFLDPAFAVRRDGNDRDATVGFRLVVND